VTFWNFEEIEIEQYLNSNMDVVPDPDRILAFKNGNTSTFGKKVSLLSFPSNSGQFVDCFLCVTGPSPAQQHVMVMTGAVWLQTPLGVKQSKYN
jgi:hypothetical protein